MKDDKVEVDYKFAYNEGLINISRRIKKLIEPFFRYGAGSHTIFLDSRDSSIYM